MTKQSTKRDAAFYEKKAKELRDKETKQKAIRDAKTTLAKLRGKK